MGLCGLYEPLLMLKQGLFIFVFLILVILNVMHTTILLSAFKDSVVNPWKDD